MSPKFVCEITGRAMNDVQYFVSYVNIPSSQAYRFYQAVAFFAGLEN
jgi:hypothetical protein